MTATSATATDWRMAARGAFWRCTSAEQVRRAFAALWREAQGATRAECDAILDEFNAALRRFGEGQEA